MNRANERISRRWSTQKAGRRSESSSTEETSSPIASTEYSPYLRNTSTPLRPRRSSDLEKINRSRDGREKVEDMLGKSDREEVSSIENGFQRFRRHKERVGRKKYQDERDRVVERQRGGHDRHGKRRHDARVEDSESEKRKNTTTSGSSNSYGESDTERSRKKKRSDREDNELPVTEILRRSQENSRTKYEHQAPFPVLTTDKIYVQHRGGFSAVKINQERGSRGERVAERERSLDVEDQTPPPIKVAIVIQEFWKNTGFVSQGLLGGMALMHFIMLQALFDPSTEFIERYSTISEVYTTMFSFLVATCIVSTFDKFDLARLDANHIRELYFEYGKAVIAVPLYLIIFCLHQICAGTDNQLNTMQYYGANNSVWENATDVQSFLDGLNSWQRITISKDLLTVFAWLFVSLGNKDDSFLMYLQSMQKYANEIDSSRP